MPIQNYVTSGVRNNPNGTGWVAGGSNTVVIGAAVAPDGNTTAFSVKDNEGAFASSVIWPQTVTADTSIYSSWIFVKKEASPTCTAAVAVTFGDAFSPTQYSGVIVAKDTGILTDMVTLGGGWSSPHASGIIDWDANYWLVYVEAANPSLTTACARYYPSMTGATGGTTIFWVAGLSLGSGVHPILLVPDFEVDSKFGIAPYTASFTDDTTGTPASWAWNFGDGNSSVSQNPTNTYTLTGYYTVALTVTDEFGSHTATKNYYVVVRAAVTSYPRIAWDNVLASADCTLSASSEASGYEKENAVDWRPYTWWKPTASGVSWLNGHFGTAIGANCMAIYAHTLGASGASVKAQFSVDGGTTYYDATPSVAPAGTEVIYLVFPYVERADWRLYVNAASAAPVIGCLFIGTDLIPEHGSRPNSTPMLNRQTVLTNTTSQNGVWLGRSVIYTGWVASISLDFLSEDFIRDDWMPFVEHAEQLPWFLLWDEANHPTEAAWCFTDGAIPGPQYTSAVLMNASIKAMARVE